MNMIFVCCVKWTQNILLCVCTYRRFDKIFIWPEQIKHGIHFQYHALLYNIWFMGNAFQNVWPFSTWKLLWTNQRNKNNEKKKQKKNKSNFGWFSFAFHSVYFFFRNAFFSFFSSVLQHFKPKQYWEIINTWVLRLERPKLKWKRAR